MIAAFPRFTPIALDILAEFNRHIAPHPPYSDFNFVNLMSWNRHDGGGVSILADNLVLLYPSYVEDKEYFLSFIGTNRPAYTIHTLLNFAERTLSHGSLQLVPELAVAALDATEGLHIVEDRDNHDYVISLTALREPEGHEFRRFRRAVRAFQSRHGDDARIRSLDLTRLDVQQAILQRFIERETEKPDNDSSYELQAIEQLLQHAQYFPLLSYGIIVNSTLQAFIICENVGHGWSIGHFWKADVSYRGIYSYLMFEVSKRLTGLGITMMNIQQDLGIASLRFFKSSFSPVTQLKKFTVRSAPGARRGIADGQSDESYLHPGMHALPAG